MRLDKLIEESSNLVKALEAFDAKPRNKRKRQKGEHNDVLVHTFIVPAYYRKYPTARPKRKLVLVHSRRTVG